MAKKQKKEAKNCDTPNCLIHKFWPAIEPAFGKNGCFYIDELTGEVVVKTGLRALPDLELVPFEECVWYSVKCECGTKGVARKDMLEQGLTGGCPTCAAQASQLKRN